MDYLTGAFMVVAILFMFVFMFIGIWSFIIYLKSYRQTRYQNYILEKISQKLNLIAANIHDSSNYNDQYSYLTGEEEFEFTDDTNNEIDDKIDNITDFNKQENIIK